jgi:hypothetical protein
MVELIRSQLSFSSVEQIKVVEKGWNVVLSTVREELIELGSGKTFQEVIGCVARYKRRM